MTKPIIAITMGDPSGVGPEIIVKALARDEVRTACRPLVIGSADVLRDAAVTFVPPGADRPPVRIIESAEAIAEAVSGATDGEGAIPVWDIPADRGQIQTGVEGAEGGRVAVEAVKAAVALALAGHIRRLRPRR
jgi:4-hydroxythreonine-4-phosphate dehydrogenase